MATTRVVLIHWKCEEGLARVEALRQAGFEAEWLAPQGSAGLRPVLDAPPDAILIDLTRLPSQSQAVAVGLRRRKTTRLVPLIFAGGLPEKVAGLRALLPDAAYTDWEHAAAAIRTAIQNAPTNPLMPDVMAAYTDTPLSRKLGITA